MNSVEFQAPGIKVKAPIIVAIVASIGTIIVAGMTTFFPASTSSQTSSKISDSIKKEISVALTEFDQQLKEIQVVKLRVAELSSIPKEVKVSSELNNLSEKLTNIDNRLINLEQYLLASPDKALGLPLISKEVDNLASSVKSERVNTQTEIARIYDQNKWFIGLMFTMAISVLGLAISSLFQSKK